MQKELRSSQLRATRENGMYLAMARVLAKCAKDADLDAIHDTVHEMAKDEV